MAVAIFERMLYNVRNYLQKGVIIMAYSIRQTKADESAAVAALAALLWHSATRQELEDEFREMAGAADTAVFLASEGETVCGFAQCSLRRDYVEGTHSSPVRYLEGIYVFRNTATKVAQERSWLPAKTGLWTTAAKNSPATVN